MRRISLRLAVALLTFTAGVVAVALWFSIQTHRPQSETQGIHTPQAALEPTEPFTRVGHMSAMTLDHGCVNSETYTAADGTLLSFSREDYGSLARAAKELRRKIKRAQRVVERTPVNDETGRQTGERVVVLWGEDGARASVLWTRDSESFSISADSLERALEFERWDQEKH